jgi:formylglycine-generating enzyme required for sulfatase activity
MRIVRGGSWVNDDVTMLRCAYRHKVPPDTYAHSIGFRIACATQ